MQNDKVFPPTILAYSGKGKSLKITGKRTSPLRISNLVLIRCNTTLNTY